MLRGRRLKVGLTLVVMGMVLLLLSKPDAVFSPATPAYLPARGLPPAPRRLLLFSYARSGSSLIGDILAHSPHVYYSFEPLRHFHRSCDYPQPLDKVEEMDDVIEGLLNCNFSRSLTRHIDRNFLAKYSDTALLHRCYGLRTPALFQACVDHAQSVCANRSTVVVKEFRYPLHRLVAMAARDLDLALLFLVRDPRASVWSRMQTFGFPSLPGVGAFATRLCRQMAVDVEGVVGMSRMGARGGSVGDGGGRVVVGPGGMMGGGGGRVGVLRYEDLCCSPGPVSRRLYAVLGLPFGPGVEARVARQTSLGPGEGRVRRVRCPACNLRRPNSCLAASRWRRHAPWTLVTRVQAACRDVMSALGYVTFTSLRDLRDLGLPARGDLPLVERLGGGRRADLGRTGGEGG